MPSDVTEVVVSEPALLTGAPRLRGALQPPSVFSTTHRSKSLRGAVPSVGRLDAKKSFFPSGESVGSMSEYWPEKGAISGVDHLPSRRRETRIHITRFAPGLPFTK